MVHSLAPVDAAYFYEIERQTALNAIWSVSVFNNLALRQQRMASLGVSAERLQFLPMDQI